MNKLTIGKKKQGNAIAKGAKIGSTVGALSGILAKNPLGGRVGGTVASTVGGAVLGAGIGAGVKGVKAIKNKLTNKKAKFNNIKLTNFNEPVFIASFPKNQIETKITKSAIELAQEKLKLKDDYSSLIDNIYRT